MLKIAYKPVIDPYWHAVCGGIPPVDRREFKLAPAPLTITVPAATGGSDQQPQELLDTLNGHAISFEVVPERAP
ncbi:MAG: hypothetical protein ABI847_14880 [Anaerolineales bacterium]